MIRQKLIRVTAAIVAAMCLTALLMGMKTSEKNSDGTVSTTLADAGSLEVGNDVRSSGVRVGQISDIRLVNGHAAMKLHVDPALLPLHSDASIRVRPANLLGENYLQLDAGSATKPFLKRAVVPMSHTTYSVSLQDALSTFKAPTAAALASMVTAAGEGVDGNGAKTAATIKALAPAMTRAKDLGDLLSQQNEALDRLVTQLDPVSTALAADNGKAVDRLVGSATKTLATVSAEHEALDSTLKQLPGTLASAQSTLAQLGGAADAATPTLRALKPVTRDLKEITAELERFSDAADPALASLQPVLKHADALLDVAAPEVAQLKAAGPNLKSVATSARPLSDQLLDKHLQDLMDFVRKWALSTNGRDSVSHYFRGVVSVTPETLQNLLDSQVPNKAAVPGQEVPLDLPDVGSLPRLSGKQDATGLSPTQEKSLMGQLLGGS